MAAIATALLTEATPRGTYRRRTLPAFFTRWATATRSTSVSISAVQQEVGKSVESISLAAKATLPPT